MRLLYSLLTLIKSPYSFIKNMEIPICGNCVHFINYFDSYNNKDYIISSENKKIYINDDIPIDNYGKCKLFGKKNIVTGKIKYEYADFCREDKEKCDLEGKYFEEKTKNESK